ncbi:hypothetical protein [Salmonella phage SD-6_S16]|nr:hypothetical protein [Salmonella phage SD-6_S16]
MKCYWTVQVMCGVLDIIRILYAGNNLISNTTTFGWNDITSSMGAVVVDSIDALYCTDGMMHIKTADGSLYAYGRNMNANAGVTGVSGVISVATKVSGLPSAVKDIRYTFSYGTVVLLLLWVLRIMLLQLFLVLHRWLHVVDKMMVS